MRRLFAIVLVFFLWVGFAPSAQADTLTKCADSPAYQQRASKARTPQAQARFENYSVLQCGPEGLPHLIVDGSLDHAGEFIIPSILFLYIAGLIGWSGRTYLNSKDPKEPEWDEVIINVPKAVGIVLSSLLWPLLAVKEFLSGELTAKEGEIPVSPR